MSAIEFVKKFGVTVASDLAYRDKTSIGYLSVEHHNLNQDDLKQIVEAFDEVSKYGGLNEAKDLHYDEFRSDTSYNKLQKAIILVEQC